MDKMYRPERDGAKVPPPRQPVSKPMLPPKPGMPSKPVQGKPVPSDSMRPPKGPGIPARSPFGKPAVGNDQKAENLANSDKAQALAAARQEALKKAGM